MTAWAAAGLIGPFFAALVHEKTGSYSITLSIFSFVFIFALIISLWIRQDIGQLKEKNKQGMQQEESFYAYTRESLFDFILKGYGFLKFLLLSMVFIMLHFTF